ncbi:MAG: PDZ domain-containing protein [Pirellulaceae bacterium]|jgi:hypothetical protein|nr:PDZ domain-containing protein [Pirellulaceae bacterium]MDP7015881.1 PDZ domain-containing protein [Pirellulaceae bacterium]
MLRRLCILIAFTMASATCAAVEGENPPPRQQLIQWASELGHDQFAVRDGATQALIAAGQPAIPVVVKTVEQGDRETKTRGVYVLYEIALSEDGAARVSATSALEGLTRSPERIVAAIATKSYTSVRRERAHRTIGRLQSLGAKFMTTRIDNRLAASSIEIDQSWKGADADIQAIEYLIDLKQVAFSGDAVNDSWFVPLEDLPDLEYVAVKRCPASDRAIESLSKVTSLIQLELKYVPVTDKSFDSLLKFRNCVVMRLYGTAITPESGAALKKAMPATKVDYRRGAFLGVGGDTHPLGCMITYVHPGSAADRVGFEIGDVIFRYTDKLVVDFDGLTALIGQNIGDDKVFVTVARNAEVAVRRHSDLIDGDFGVTGKAATLGYQVDSVVADSPAAGLKVEKGDVLIRINETRIIDQKTLDQALSDAKQAMPFRGYTLQVARNAEIIRREAVLGEWE